MWEGVAHRHMSRCVGLRNSYSQHNDKIGNFSVTFWSTCVYTLGKWYLYGLFRCTVRHHM